MSETIEKISIRDLRVDEMNSRKESWISDDELIDSIKKVGLLNPLVVRPKEGGKYGIVCGFRRYNAATEAGLTEIPCKVEELTDIEAKAASLQENMQRDNLSESEIAKNVVELWRLAREEGIEGCEEKVEFIHDKTGLAMRTIYQYKNIAKLLKRAPVVAELLKPEEERDKEKLEESKIATVAKKLSTPIAGKIGANIGKKIPDSKSDILRVSGLGAEMGRVEGSKLINIYDRVKGHSDEAIKKITKKCVEFESPKEEEFLAKVEKKEADVDEVLKQLTVETYSLPKIKVNKRVDKAIKRAMKDVDMKRPELILKIIKSWLKKEGYLIG